MKKLIILLTLGLCMWLASYNFPIAVILSIVIVAMTKSKNTTLHYGIMCLCILANPFYMILFVIGEVVRFFNQMQKQKSRVLFVR